jgi:hypothetical protein
VRSAGVSEKYRILQPQGKKKQNITIKPLVENYAALVVSEDS